MGTREDVYQLLEAKMLKYADYAEVPVIEVDEVVLFEPVPQQGVLRVEHVRGDERAHRRGDLRTPAGGRHALLAGQELKNLDRSLTLKVVYGFRALEVQTRLFEEAKASLAGQYPDEDELIEATHRHVAVPSVAGYPTGGAVAVEILRDEQPVDMGTPVMEADRDSFTFSPFVSPDAWAHRQLLRRAMMAAGFAPFDGEWWHFSYGDKEWARFYRQQGALRPGRVRRRTEGRPRCRPGSLRGDRCSKGTAGARKARPGSRGADPGRCSANLLGEPG